MKIHAGLLKGLSGPLHAMINNGHMTESVAGVAVLEDVEPATFAAFCEFAYTGTYTTPEYSAEQVIDHPGNDAGVGTSKVGFDGWLDWIQPAKRRKKSRKRKRDSTSRDEDDYSQLQEGFDYLLARSPYRKFHDIKLDSPPRQTEDPDFVFGAKLYVFATHFLVTPLRLHILKTLYVQLPHGWPCGRVRARVNDLLLFVYEHTASTEPGGQSFLRDLLMTYVSRNVKSLNHGGGLVECGAGNVELNSDLLAALLKKY